MSADQDRLMEIFGEALNQPSPEARACFLAEACGADEGLRRQVEVLLDAHARVGNFLRPPAEDPPDSERPGTMIGRYKLLQPIGEGGFGRVYMAEQQEPVRRKVALKIIKLGMDTREVIARFEAERQALAMMDHPCIAKILDAGVTGTPHPQPLSHPMGEGGLNPDEGTPTLAPRPSSFATHAGRPYFVMELVKGIPITDYCDRENLPTEARLQLFMKVCHAVQHAHQKGIIHRDLKPANVLVTVVDGAAVPKVIDFGIAKAIGQELTQKTLFTRFEQMIGTPAYLSPEQAALSGVDVDTRSDIYSLGVMLYELLTGMTPLDQEILRKAALDEIRRIIRETEPPTPSTRLTALARSQKSEVRGQKPEARWKEVRGDLDWIVMKALEKDRRRRYETATALALDIQHHLHHEPVEACPPSRGYQLRKFIRRHRVGVVMAGAVTAALLVGLTAAVLGFAQAQQQRTRAQSEAAIAAAVNEFLQEDLLAQADPENEPDRDLKLRTVLDRAAQKIEGRFTNQPLVESSIRLTLGQTYLGLGEANAAEPHLRRAVELRTQALGPEHPDTLKAMEWVGQLLMLRAQYGEAVRYYQSLWETSSRVLGAEHPGTLTSLQSLGSAHYGTGNYRRAAEILGQTLEAMRRTLGPGDPRVWVLMQDLSVACATSGQEDKAAQLSREVLELRRHELGPDHPSTLISMHNLAMNQWALGNHGEAVTLLKDALQRYEHVYGEKSMMLILPAANLARLYGCVCSWPKCLELCRKMTSVTNAYVDKAHFWFDGAVAALLIGDTNA